MRERERERKRRKGKGLSGEKMGEGNTMAEKEVQEEKKFFPFLLSSSLCS